MNILDKELKHADQVSEILLYEYIEAQKQEISELRAQLARCVDVLTWCGLMFGVNDMPKCRETIYDFIDVDLKKAKATAEVLRCAEELVSKKDSSDDYFTMVPASYFKSLKEAVRVAKEERDE